MHHHISCFNTHLSSDFNHPSFFIHEQTPLLISSSPQCCCCSCCCCCCDYASNVSICDSLGPINPNLIHWSFCKRLIFHCRFKESYAGTASGVSSFIHLDRKISSLKEIRKKGFRGFGHKRKKQFLSNVSDDVEVMLNLLTDDVGLECRDFSDSKKFNKKHICCDDKEKKILGFRVVKRDEVVKVRSNDRRKILTESVNLDLRKGDSDGDLEGDKDFEVKSDEHLGVTFSRKYKNKDHEVFIDKVLGNVGRQEACAKDQAKVLDTVKGSYGESVVVSQDFRKKTEKRLNEEFRQESNVSANMNNAGMQQHSRKVDILTDESGSRMKYIRFEEMSVKDNSVIKSSFSFQKQYNNTEKKLEVISENSKTQEMNQDQVFGLINGQSLSDSKTPCSKSEANASDNFLRTSSSLSSKSRIKNQEENSTEVSERVKENREEKHHKMDNLIRLRTVSREKSQRVLGISDDGSGRSHRKEGGSGHSSQGSGPKGPSDEMWHVTDASTPEPSETDAADHISDLCENSGVVKSTNGRSLWTIIGDVVRFHRAPSHSESHTPNSGGGKGSSYVSANSETDKSVPDLLTETQTGESGNDTKNRDLKKSKLVYKDQVFKDNFDEWEMGYAIEAKQRKNDEMFMREALVEAKKAADVWEVPVGAVLVHDGKIIARGYNLVEELRDSTAHAEMICIRKASTNLCSWRLPDTTLYVTLEPCPMCAGAILQARIDTVVWGAPNKLLGADGSWIRPK